MILLFIVFYIFTVLVNNSKIPVKRKEYIYLFSFILVALFVGFRDPEMWNDSAGYEIAFTDYTKALDNFSFHDKPFGYTEFGFYFVGVIIKTFTENSTIYFIIISLITFLFLYIFAKKFCMFPLIGLVVYMGRFMPGRNMMQIRAALAIAVLICGTQYITKQQLWKFLAVIIVAYTLHHSAIVAIPVYFMNKMKISQIHIILGLILPFIFTGFWGETIKDLISNSNFVNDMASSYIQEDSDKAFSYNLGNPMIYYQCIILLIFTFYEKKLSVLTEHYYTIRNAYFYCTLLLIILCQYAVIAARTSTLFATYEMVMVPMFIMLFNKRNRIIPFIAIGIVYSVFFYINYKPLAVTMIHFNQ
jgi:hypothetical protein